MTTLAAFQVLLYRCSGQADLVVGTPFANRNRLETEPLIGFFANLLPIRADLSGGPTFRRFLAPRATPFWRPMTGKSYPLSGWSKSFGRGGTPGAIRFAR